MKNRIQRRKFLIPALFILYGFIQEGWASFNDFSQETDHLRIVDDRTYRQNIHPFVQGFFTIADDLNKKNQQDISVLQVVLKQCLPGSSFKKNTKDFQNKILQMLEQDRHSFIQLQQSLASLGTKAEDWYPFHSCIAKFVGSKENPGILQESAALLVTHPSLLEGNLTFYGEKGPQHHEITIVKNLLFYAILAARNAANCMDPVIDDLVKNLSVFYPAALKFVPDKEEPPTDELKGIASKISLFAPLGKHKIGFWFSNAGFVFGANCYEPENSASFPAEPMGDCSSLIGHLLSPFIPILQNQRMSTHLLEGAALIIKYPEINQSVPFKNLYPRQYWDILENLTQSFMTPALDALEPGDLIVWRPNHKETGRTLAVGHMAIYLGPSPDNDPNHIVTIDLKRNDLKNVEGISVRSVLLKREDPDADHIFMTYALRLKPKLLKNTSIL